MKIVRKELNNTPYLACLCCDHILEIVPTKIRKTFIHVRAFSLCFSDEIQAQLMERGRRNRNSQLSRYAVCHFFSRFMGKGDKENVLRAHTLLLTQILYLSGYRKRFYRCRHPLRPASFFSLQRTTARCCGSRFLPSMSESKASHRFDSAAITALLYPVNTSANLSKVSVNCFRSSHNGDFFPSRAAFASL